MSSVATKFLTPWCKSEDYHGNCAGRIENGVNVSLGLDSKGNQTRAPKGPYVYCQCPRCDHFPAERI